MASEYLWPSPDLGCTRSLERLRAKLALLEQQADLLDMENQAAAAAEAQERSYERRNIDLIRAAHDRPRSLSAPALGASATADTVSELKSYLQAVVDADRAGDEVLSGITERHCITYAVEVVNAAVNELDRAAPGVGNNKAVQRLLDLATATLSTLAHRSSARELMLSCGAVPALISLFAPAPRRPAAAVSSALSALGALSADAACRAALRGQGAAGAVVRLLRAAAAGGGIGLGGAACAAGEEPFVADTATVVAAAGALGLLASRDPVVKDTIRFLGGIEVLVELMAPPNTFTVAEAARSCLSCLKADNPKNESEILQAVRTSAALARDHGCLRDALDLLRRDGGGGGGGGGGGAAGWLAAEREGRARLEMMARVGEEEQERRCHAALCALRHNLRSSVGKTELRLIRDASAAAARATERAASIVRTRPYGPAAAAAAAASSAAVAASVEARAGVRRGGSGVSARSALGKHLVDFTCAELCALLSESGWPEEGLSGVRRSGTTGAELLLHISATDSRRPSVGTAAAADAFLADRARMTPKLARRLRRLGDATALFDAVASHPAQPRLTEIELRLWLVGSGCTVSEAGRAARLMMGLVAGDDAAGRVTFWEWAVGWRWVTHALEVFGIDWRSALL